MVILTGVCYEGGAQMLEPEIKEDRRSRRLWLTLMIIGIHRSDYWVYTVVCLWLRCI